MPRRRKDCPICGKRNLVKLSNHLADVHQLSAVERKYYLSGASDAEKPGDMSSRKRMRCDLEDDMSTVARDEDLKKKCRVLKECEMNPTMKRQQFRTKIFSVHRMTTKVPKRLHDDASNEGEISKETDDASNEGEISEETNDSDE